MGTAYLGRSINVPVQELWQIIYLRLDGAEPFDRIAQRGCEARRDRHIRIDELALADRFALVKEHDVEGFQNADVEPGAVPVGEHDAGAAGSAGRRANREDNGDCARIRRIEVVERRFNPHADHSATVEAGHAGQVNQDLLRVSLGENCGLGERRCSLPGLYPFHRQL